MTEDIARRVAHIRSTAMETIKAVNTIIADIASVEEKTSSIASAVEEQNASAVEISRNVQEAAAGTGEVTRSVAQILDIAGQSAQSTDKLKQDSVHLSGQAQHMTATVSGFLTGVKEA
jgi:methyl-accepting chemotaxis protein